MQSTTRSVEAVEGVAVAKAMASGGTVSSSASAGGKPSFVVNIGGGRSNKRKGSTGGHSSISITLGHKKKLCSGANEMARVAEAAAIKDIGGGQSITEKKEKNDEVVVGDPLEDAAKTLTQLFFLAHQPVPSPSSSSHPSTIPALPQWKKTKLRSGRTKRLESSSNEDSHVVIATDSSNPSPLSLESKQLPLQQVSEGSCSPGGHSQSVITPVKVEDNLLCSITGAEGEQQVEQKKGELEVEDLDENSTHRFPSDPDRLPKLASVSSIESLQPDSRAESPVSPLPAVLSTGEFASIVPKLEGSSPIGRSAFQRVRPVKKPAPTRKLKVEEKTFEDLNPEQAGVKHVSRKKPRPTGFLPQQEQEQDVSEQQPPLQQLACVKIEDGDVCALALGPPRLSAAEEALVKRIGETSSITPSTLVAVVENTVKLDPALVKVEIKLPGKLGPRGGAKVKPALSESEKEARKQRRVQANRESARLTIRKKQVLCEELTKRADFLTTENADIREKVALIREKNKSMSEANAKLSEQVAKANGKHEPELASPPAKSVENPPDGSVHYQFPPSQFGGVQFPDYVWACALAQVAQAAGVQTSDIKMGSPHYTALFAATAAAAAACGNNTPGGFWSVASSSSQAQALMFSPFYRGHMSGASVPSALPSSSGAPATASAISRSVSLPVAPTDGSSSHAAALERTMPSVKPVARYRSGDFSDSGHLPHDLKRGATKQDSAHLGSGFSGRTHYFQMPSGSHAGTAAVNGLGTIATRKVGEASCPPMPNTLVQAQLLGRSRSLSAPHGPKLHSRYPAFVSGGLAMALEQQQQPSGRESEARRKGAAATEARRKRIELKRTKSLLKARVAEPSSAQ